LDKNSLDRIGNHKIEQEGRGKNRKEQERIGLDRKQQDWKGQE